MKFKYLLLSIIGSVFLCSFIIDDDPVLESFKQKVVSSYSKYFEPIRENVYTHINKSLYLAGEDIWMKTYVTNASSGKLLNVKSTNLYTDLYGPNGKLVVRKVWRLTSGLAAGDLHLADTLASGTYTLKVYTNWMRNFEKERIFTSSIRIYGAKEAIIKPDSSPTRDWDVQFFPEGGNLITELDNRLAVKIVDPNGKGKAVSGTIKDSKGEILGDFQTNHLGFSALNLNLQTTEKLTAEIKFPDGSTKQYGLPETLKKGITLSANTFVKDRLIFVVKTNAETLSDLKGKKFFCMIHSNGTIHKLWHFLFSDEPVIVNLQKSDLPAGINTITLFDENHKPVSERLFFNHKKEIIGDVKLSHERQGDSVLVKVAASDINGKPLTASLSMSVLPSGTIANKFENDIYSQLLLKSEVRGVVENPKYYFENDDFQHLSDLDNLLLTQGWRKYNWSEILNVSGPKTPLFFENGFEMKGSVKNFLNGKVDTTTQLTLFISQPFQLNSAKVDSKGNFLFPNLYLLDSSRVIITASNKKGKGWNRFIEANIAYPNLENSTDLNYFAKEKFNAEEVLRNLLPGMLQLNEVVVKGTRQDQNPFKNDMYSGIMDQYYVITKDNHTQYNTIADLLNWEFNVSMSNDANGIKIDMSNSSGGNGNPALIIDGMKFNDLSILSMYNLNDIEAIAINKGNNLMLGRDGGSGVIRIKTRMVRADWDNQNGPANVKNILANGYSLPVAYYAPKYAARPGDDFHAKYASLYWKPNIATDSTGITEFKFFLPKEIQEMEVRIEGISTQGHFFYREDKVKVALGS
ncbi:CDC50/LEM3 family protein [Solitalea koreensis]|uniref:MG2 domain-containing protein n=1 Tax=Solitalea koreensis TaxID=543615 RepID=A0A521DRA3_9SPHI|nr:Plug domain-containing protein [Solitalea koreensis]SMO74243.1 hypothetical protein SAMN06265350_10852 [Solitalea koreensis]